MAWKHAAWAGLALLLAGCLNQADNKAADDATTQFYQRVAARQYAAIWDDAAQELKLATPKDQFVTMMQHIDDVMGTCQPATKNGAWSSNINNGVAMRTQGYQRVCAHGTLTEKVTVVVRDHVAKIGGFSFNSPGATATNSAMPATNTAPANTAVANTAEPPLDNTLEALTHGQIGNAPSSGDTGGSTNNGGGDRSGDDSSGKDRGSDGGGDQGSNGGGDDNQKHF